MPAPSARPSALSVALLGLLALAGAAFLPALDGPFQYDDGTAILGNPRVRSAARLAEAFAPADLLGPGRPVTELAHAAVRAVAGEAPRAFHLASLLAHLAVAALVFLLVRAVLTRLEHPRAGPLAVAVAALFAVHPLQTEAVCYASQLSEVLAALLGLGALLLLLRAEARDAAGRGPPWGSLAASLGAALVLLLAIGAKAVAAAVPAAFLAVAWLAPAPGRQAGRWRALRLAAPSLAVSAAAVARNLLALDGAATTAGASAGLSAGVGPWRYLLSEARVHWLYLRLAVWPAGQTIDHAVAPSPGLADPPTLAAVAALLALLAVVGVVGRRAARRPAPDTAVARAVTLGLLWWFLLLAPTSTVVPIDDLAAEHRVYLALAGLLLAAVAGADAALAAWRPGRRAAAAALAAGVGLALWATTAARAATWRSDVDLWRDAAEQRPGSVRAAANHALALQQAGRTDEAAAEYARALRLPDDPARVAGAAMNYAAFLMERGDFAGAVAVADLGVAAAPGRHEVRANRALSLAALGRLDEALAEAQRCVALAPQAPFPRYVLGATLRQQGRLDEARRAFAEAIERGRDGGLAARPTFVALAALGRREEGCLAWREVERAGQGTAGLRRAAAALGCLATAP